MESKDMAMQNIWRRYLFWFAHEHLDLRNAEMQSILTMYKIPIKYIEKPNLNKPYWIVELPSDECVKRIASRSVLIKNCIELWSRSRKNTQLHNNLQKSLCNLSNNWLSEEISKNENTSETNICPRALIDACCSPDISFKIEVETFCRHFSLQEKLEKIEEFSYLPLQGSVKLKNPDITLTYIEFYGIDPNDVPEKPYEVFFGKLVVEGQRELIQQYSLKKRPFIGNTSMDAQLALLMANQAQITPSDLVLDPFVGSGSLLVAAAHFGAYVWGSDIDFMMLHGRTKPTRAGQKVRKEDESIRGNMRQYGIESRYLDVLVSDFSRSLWNERLQFDAIITDPPYGIRESTEKIGIERDNYSLEEHHLTNHVPSKVEYALEHIYRDLLQFAVKHLRVNRRLVCWYPVVREEYTEEQLPSHPCLRLVANSEQVLNRLTSRRLLTYEKIMDGDSKGSDPTIHDATVESFRDRYFAVGEISRRERKLQHRPPVRSTGDDVIT